MLHALGMSGFPVNGYSDLVIHVAEQGFAVVTCMDYPVVRPPDTVPWVQDTIIGAKEQLNLPDVDFSRTAVMGHSMGGGATIHAIANSQGPPYNIKAGVAMHPWMFEAPEPLPQQITSVPMMYLTGTSDTNVKPADVLRAYDDAHSTKIFANGQDFDHFAPLNEPLGNGKWSKYAASFLACHARSNQAACDEVDQQLPKETWMADFRSSAPTMLSDSAMQYIPAKSMQYIPAKNTTDGLPFVGAADGFDSKYRFGSPSASRLIIMFVGTSPSSCSQTGASFFGSSPSAFASQLSARILCMFRDGTQYSFGHVSQYAGYIRAQMHPGQQLIMAGYSNGGGVSACVGSTLGAYAFADWAGTADIHSKGCDKGYRNAALFSATGDIYRTAELSSFHNAQIPFKYYYVDTPGSHTTPIPASLRNEYWSRVLQ